MTFLAPHRAFGRNMPRPGARLLTRVASALALTSSLLLLGSARADVRLPALFTDHMVLQQEMQVPVWGWADDGESVTVEFRGKKVSTVAKAGKWSVKLAKQKPGAPGALVVAGKNNRLEINDVVVGEVWIASGQSNMEWPLARSFESTNDIASSGNPDLRLFTVPKLKAVVPVADVKGNWQLAAPDTVPNFSAVGYYFGRALQQARKVPVGIIHTSWGGSPAEVWMSEEMLRSTEEYQHDILDTFPAAWRAYQKTKTQAEKEGKPAPWPIWRPCELYNGMIAPLIPYAIRGAIWYQGESNAGRAWQYRRLYADMIRNWRQDWKQGDFTFLAVQLAPWDKNRKRSIEEITAAPGDSDWAELREAQDLSTKTLPNVGVAVITDVGDKDDIHPTKKAPVGERLALAARVIAYKEKITGSGPVYRSAKFSKGKAELSFDNVGQGLEARGGKLQGFAIAGADQKFVWADASIEGSKVVVSSPAVAEPVAVRYGWSDNPVVNLWNKEGLPASPFRTDDFQMVTRPKTDAPAKKKK